MPRNNTDPKVRYDSKTQAVSISGSAPQRGSQIRYNKKPSRWERFKAFFRRGTKNLRPSSAEIVSATAKRDFLEAEIDKIAEDVFGDKGSPANKKLKLLIKSAYVADVNQGLLSDLTTEIERVASSYENNAIEASDKSKAIIIREALQAVGYDRTVLQEAIRRCADNTAISSEQAERIMRPLFVIRGANQRIKWPIGLAELAKAVNPKNPTTFNCLVDIMAVVNSVNNPIPDPEDKKQLEQIVMQGLKEINNRSDEILKYMSEGCIISCAKIAAAYQGAESEYNMQRSFIEKCANALDEREPGARATLLKQCAEIANSRNTQGGRLATDIVMTQGAEVVFDSIADIIGFDATAQGDDARRQIFVDFIANSDVKGSRVLSLAASREHKSAAAAIGLEITNRKIAPEEMVGILVSQMPVDAKSELLKQYCAVSAGNYSDFIEPDPEKKLLIIQAALLNKINPEAIIKAMQIFSNDAVAGGKVSINSSQVLLGPVTRYLTEKYGQDNSAQMAEQPLGGSASSDRDIAISNWIQSSNQTNTNTQAFGDTARELVIETLRFMEQGGYRAKNHRQAEQEAFDKTLGDSLNSVIFDRAGGEVLQFMKKQGLDIAGHINKNITKQSVLRQLLEKQNELKDPGLLTADAFGKLIAHDDPFAIKAIPDLIKNFTSQAAITKELFEYLLFTPHQTDVFDKKMAAATAMLEKNSEIIDRSTLKAYATMMLVAQDQAVVSAAKKIVDQNSRLLESDLNKKFQDHAEEVATAERKRPIAIRDAERYATRAYQKNAAFVSEMNLKYQDPSQVVAAGDSIFFSVQNSLAQELRGVINRLGKGRVAGDTAGTEVGDGEFSDSVSASSLISGSNARIYSAGSLGVFRGSGEALPEGDPRVTAVMRDVTEYLKNAESLLSHKAMPNKAYSLSADELRAMDSLRDQLKILDAKIDAVTLSTGETTVGSIIKSAMSLLDKTVSESRPALSRENLTQIQNVLKLAASRADQVYTLIYQPMEGFMKKSKDSVDRILAEHTNAREDAKNFMRGDIGHEMADNLERASEIIADPQNKHIAYAAVHALQYLAIRLDDISSGKIKLTKQGVELMRQLTEKQLKETKLAAQNLEESMDESIEEFLKTISKDAYAKVGVTSSESAETQFAIDINQSVAASVGAVVDKDLALIKKLLQKLPKQMPSSSINGLQQAKEVLSKIAKENAGKSVEVAQQAKQLKKEIDQIIGRSSFVDAPQGGAADVAKDVGAIQKLAGHIQESQQQQQLLNNLAIEAGKKVAKLEELRDQLSEAENYTKNKKIVQNIEKQLESLQQAAAKIGGNDKFPASKDVIRLMNAVNNSMREIGRSGNSETISVALQTTKDLSGIISQIDRIAARFPLDFELRAAQQSSIAIAPNLSQQAGLNVASIPLPSLPDMTALGPDATQRSHSQNFQGALEQKRDLDDRNSSVRRG